MSSNTGIPSTTSTQQALLIILRALSKGLSYGVRIRLPHALVTGVLYAPGGGAWANSSLILKRAMTSSFEHGRNLAYFAGAYKLVLYLLRLTSIIRQKLGIGGGDSTGDRRSSSTSISSSSSFYKPEASMSAAMVNMGRPSHLWHSAVAGGIASAIAWRSPSPVNTQVCFYLLSRVLIACCKVASQSGILPFSLVSWSQVWPVMSVSTWAAVMYLWEAHRGNLHPSLARSMDEIYALADEDILRGFDSGLGRVVGSGGGRSESSSSRRSNSEVAVSGLRALIPTPAAAAVLAYALATGLQMTPG